MQLTTITACLAAATIALANPAPTCGTCNPLSGQNSCDITTSCINTGSTFHCACRAGYKASKDNNNIHSQFRLNMPNYEFLVFVPQNTVCNTLCDNPYAAPSNLCNEVKKWNSCAV
ncbi:adhesin [Penicillium brasilianum]|uniref:Adhesin n=1 Tax=Penicillium brasilianum TaxID=104259 RepID=A0A1S9RJ53_PENBI|nr:adhesin [Penicillium brasilianum]